METKFGFSTEETVKLVLAVTSKPGTVPEKHWPRTAVLQEGKEFSYQSI